MANRDFFPRFYDKKGKVMLYWQCYMQSAFNILNESQPFGLLYKLLKDSNVVMMRCTGVRDRNEKFIYEGDLLMTYDRCIGKIEYDKNRAAFVMTPINKENAHGPQDWSANCVVIGTIYENPEYLDSEE